MSVEIKEVLDKKALKTFVKLPFPMYRKDPMWIPQLIRDDMEIFSREKNPAYENADARLFLAYKGGKPVGRVAAIHSRIANQKYGTKNLRFGWFDAPDDAEVAAALFQAVEDWARELGLETLTGPQGFCDLDPQGMLIEGFDQLPTIAGYYNYPYYRKLVEGLGFQKEIDYVEFRTQVPADMSAFPEKLLRLAERIQERGGLRLLKFRNKKEILGRAQELFHLLDEAFEEIYGSVPLTERQVNYYVKKYFSFVDKDLIQAVVNDKDEMVGFMIAMPSLSRAFQKARGRLLPLGWWHILRALKRSDVLDFYLAGVRRAYRGMGVDLLMVVQVAHGAVGRFRFTESNQELENNTKIQAQWKYFNPVQHKRKRIYKKTLSK
jgi:hypothetical protein